MRGFLRPSGVPVDVVLAGPGLEEMMMGRARRVRLDRANVPVVAPEDLVVLKILAGRPQDLSDVETLLRGGERIDTANVRTTLTAVERALGQSDLLPRFQQLLSSASSVRKKGRIRRKRR
jgi:hypothetical protein